MRPDSANSPPESPRAETHSHTVVPELLEPLSTTIYLYLNVCRYRQHQMPAIAIMRIDYG